MWTYIRAVTGMVTGANFGGHEVVIENAAADKKFRLRLERDNNGGWIAASLPLSKVTVAKVDLVEV